MSKSKPSENELKEKLNQVGKDISKLSVDKKLSYDDALIKAERSLLMLCSEGLKNGFFHIKSHLNQVIEILEEVRSGKQQPTYQNTGLIELDEMLCGLNAGTLYIIGGSPGMGKTALALTILRHAAVVERVPTGIFSLDLTGTHIALRLLCMEAKVDSYFVRTGKLTKSQWKEFTSSMATLAETSIFIDDMKSLSSLKMKHNAIRLKAEYDIKLLIVDYLQLIEGIGKNDKHKEEARLICRLLKTMAVELDIAVIVTSQLTQKPEDWEYRRPVLNELNYAYEIEESADIIILLYRPWMDTPDETDRGKAEVIIAKNRNGPTGYINLRFIEKYALFE